MTTESGTTEEITTGSSDETTEMLESTESGPTEATESTESGPTTSSSETESTVTEQTISTEMTPTEESGKSKFHYCINRNITLETPSIKNFGILNNNTTILTINYMLMIQVQFNYTMTFDLHDKAHYKFFTQRPLLFSF